MAVRLDLRNVVVERGRRIATEARARARAQAPRREGERARAGWLGRAFDMLPEPLRDVLREALGPDERLEQAREALRRLRRERDDLRNREGALDQARDDLDRSRRTLEDTRIEMGARERDVERMLAQAQRAAAEASVERRVPLRSVRWDAADSPRPIRAVARLAANIKRFGQLTPVVVRPEGDVYTLVCGYRRMAALAEAGFTHANVRVVADLDDETAAALYIAENCLADGISSNAVRDLAESDGDRPGFATVLPLVLADDDEVVEELYLDEMADEARHHLAEGAAWVSALRPYWADLDDGDRTPLEQLVVYFAKVASRLR